MRCNTKFSYEKLFKNLKTTLQFLINKFERKDNKQKKNINSTFM